MTPTAPDTTSLAPKIEKPGLGKLQQYAHILGAPGQDDRKDFRGAILATSIVLIICSFVSVASRLARSWKAQDRFMPHDVLILLAGICAIIMSAGCAHLTGDGLGMHDYNDHIAQDGHFQKLVIAVNVFYFSCNYFVKLALLQMYRSFTRDYWPTRLLDLMVVLSTLFWIGSVLATTLTCIPLQAVWDWSITEGWCMDLSMFYISNASIMIGMDIVLYATPIVFTYHLKMPRSRKIGLNILFGLGTIVLTASAVRLWIVHQAVSEGDLSYNYGRSLLVSQVENHIAIMIACAPAIRYVFLQAGRQSLSQVKDALNSSRPKFGRLWSSSASSAASSPFSDRFQVPTPRQSSFRLPKSTKVSTLSSLWGGSSKAATQFSNHDDKCDLELGFHDTTCEFMPTITTTITAGGAPPRPPSQKNKIYITRAITVTEEYIRSPDTTAPPAPASDSDRASTYSFMSTDTSDVTAMDLAALPMPSPKPSKENFTDEDGVMRKDFADKLKAHVSEKE